MFENIKDYIEGAGLAIDASGKPTERDLQIAVIGMLMRVAYSDSELESQELNAIRAAMLHEFGLSSYESGELIEISEFLIKDRNKLEQFISAINDNFNDQQKQFLIAMVWKVLLADGKAEKLETKLASELRVKLGLSLEQGVRARKIAEDDHIKIMATKIIELSEDL